jgi:hypothetical protein
MNNLISRIQNLIDFRSEIGQPIEQHFLPGLSREYLQEQVAQYPFYFPEEFIELYTWHNGTNDEDFLMFRDMAWLSFENSLSEYDLMLEHFWSVCDQSEIKLQPEQMFPFAAFSGFCLYLSYPGQQMCPDVEIPIIATGKGLLDPYFTSFNSMLDTVEEWFAIGQHNEYACEVRADIERDIWRKHNSEVIRF